MQYEVMKRVRLPLRSGILRHVRVFVLCQCGEVYEGGVLAEVKAEDKDSAYTLYYMEPADGCKVARYKPRHILNSGEYATMVLERSDDCIAGYTYYIYRSEKTRMVDCGDTYAYICHRYLGYSAGCESIRCVFLYVWCCAEYKEEGFDGDMRHICNTCMRIVCGTDDSDDSELWIRGLYGTDADV